MLPEDRLPAAPSKTAPGRFPPCHHWPRVDRASSAAHCDAPPRTKPCPERRLVQLPDARTFTPCSHSAALPESPQCKTRTHPTAQRPRGSHMSSSSTHPLAAPSLQPGWNPSCNPNPPRAAQLGFLSVWVTFSPQRPGMRLDLFFSSPFRQGNGSGRFPPPVQEGRERHGAGSTEPGCGAAALRERAGPRHRTHRYRQRSRPRVRDGNPAAPLCLGPLSLQLPARPAPRHCTAIRMGRAVRGGSWPRRPSPRCAVTLVLKPALCEAVRPQLALGRRGGCFKGPIHGASPLCLPPRPRWGFSHAAG